MLKKIAILTFALLVQVSASADSLESCPVEAFLVQGKPSKLFSVDLTTGSYSLLAGDLGTRGVLNAIAFNTADNYLYAWGYEDNSLVRIGSNFQVEPLVIKNMPNSTYYVGDISNTENAYYMYRRGGGEQHGLWRIALDPSASDYLDAQRVSTGRSNYVSIFDFAFHPVDGQIYSINNRGDLYRLTPETGAAVSLGNVGVKGTFGAIYFDAEGYLYASRNKDGKIFRVDPLSEALLAEEFAQGPASSNNDGARCSTAAVEIQDPLLVDFGGAPESYGTSLGSNGPRHGSAGAPPLLGSFADGETQAQSGAGYVPDDGVNFVTDLSLGRQAILQVKATGNGYLNGWVDFGRDGSFDESDVIIKDVQLDDEVRNLVFETPKSASTGETWGRFRITSEPGAGPLGGLPDGEVEDYQIMISPSEVSNIYYPSAGGFVTLAFEDLWPSGGDYDMNDVVVFYRTTIRLLDDKIVGVSVNGQITAMGAAFHNGFAVEIPNVQRENIDESTIEFILNGLDQVISPLEAGQENAVFVVTDDVWGYVAPAEGCSFYRTENNCGEGLIQSSFTINATLLNPIPVTDIGDNLFNPFIFATPGYQRSSFFSEPPGRGLEIHLKNRPPTLLANPTLLGRADDRSNPGSDTYYQNAEGLPWAMEIGTEWLHPAEYQDTLLAYPQFRDWVSSEGEQEKDWYLPSKANKEKLYGLGKE